MARVEVETIKLHIYDVDAAEAGRIVGEAIKRGASAASIVSSRVGNAPLPDVYVELNGEDGGNAVVHMAELIAEVVHEVSVNDVMAHPNDY